MPNIPTELETGGQLDHQVVQPTDNTQPSSSENQIESDFLSMDAWIVYRLVQDNAISAEPSKEGKNYTVDLLKATEILKDCFSQPELENTQTSKPNNKLETHAQTALKRSIKAFVDNEVLTPFIVLQVGNITRPSNVQTGGYGARFKHHITSLSTPISERATIQIGREFAVNSEAEQIRQVTRTCGLNFTDEEIADLALRSLVSHEYGHAVASALILNQAYMVAPRRPNLTIEQVYQEAAASFYNAIFTSVTPNTELASILKTEPPNGTYSARHLTSVERFAQGFQYLGLRFALEGLGLDENKAEAVIVEYAKQNEKGLRDWIKTYELIHSHGLTLEDIGEAVASIKQNLKERKLDTLRKQFNPYVNAASLGYFFPLNRSQLDEVIDQTWSGKIWNQKAA